MRSVVSGSFSPVLPLLLVMACASSTQLDRQITDPEVPFLRKVYFAEHPGSPHMDEIKRGTVVAGMDTAAVIAAWGNPQARTAKSPDAVQWTYYDIDMDSGDPMDHVLAFNTGLLASWDTRVHNALGNNDVFAKQMNELIKEQRAKERLTTEGYEERPYSPQPAQKKEEKKP